MGGNRGELAGRRARAKATVRRREGRWAGLSLVVAMILVGMALIDGGDDPVLEPAPAPSGSSTSEPLPQVPAQAPPPSSGPGTYLYDRSAGRVLGGGGPIARFRLAVESNLDKELGEFSRLTDATLSDPRSWVSGKRQRFQRVPDGASSDFTIALVTRETAAHLCGLAGLDIRVDGIPFTSCQGNNWVVINLDRWRLSVPDYVRAGIPLLTYRQYVINHEVGHELGHGHEVCPGEGELAPTMQQQTLGLEGCLANPWPFPNGVT